MTKYIHSKHTTEEAYKTFFEVLKLNRLSSICFEAWKFFNVPVLITDENYTLLSCFPQEPIGVDVWDTLLSKKVLPRQTIYDYQSLYLGNLPQSHYAPFYADSGLVESCPRIFGEIFTSDHIIGHVALFMFDNPLYESDLDCVQIFIDALNLVMQQQSKAIRNTNENYLLNLLKEKKSSELRYVARNSLMERITGNYAVMVTKIGNSAANNAFETMITSSIPSTFSDTVSVVFDRTVVSLFGRISGGAFTEKEKAFFSRVSAFIESAQLPSGISEPYENLDETSERYKQALLAAGNNKGKITYFYEIYPDPIFRAASKYIDTRFYIHPTLLKIKEFDQVNGTDYFHTLEVYSLLFHDKETTADKLCIHRNTLHYRLTRIEELFQLNLKDTRTSIGLLNSFQILKTQTI